MKGIRDHCGGKITKGKIFHLQRNFITVHRNKRPDEVKLLMKRTLKGGNENCRSVLQHKQCHFVHVTKVGGLNSRFKRERCFSIMAVT